MKIKFRVWHKIEKRYLDAWAEEDPMLCLKDYGDGCEVYRYSRKTGDYTNENGPPEHITIEQFTGFADKEGVEIYEGDILECKNTGQSSYSNASKTRREVRRCKNTCSLSLFDPYVEHDRPASGFQLSKGTQKRFTVIGNIHDQRSMKDE